MGNIHPKCQDCEALFDVEVPTADEEDITLVVWCELGIEEECIGQEDVFQED